MSNSAHNKNMKRFFKIYYSFDGQGYLNIEAKTQKEAEQRFKDGDWELHDNEWGDNYEIIEIAEEG